MEVQNLSIKNFFATEFRVCTQVEENADEICTQIGENASEVCTRIEENAEEAQEFLTSFKAESEDFLASRSRKRRIPSMAPPTPPTEFSAFATSYSPASTWILSPMQKAYHQHHKTSNSQTFNLKKGVRGSVPDCKENVQRR
jgi:hypothetical protein